MRFLGLLLFVALLVGCSYPKDIYPIPETNTNTVTIKVDGIVAAKLHNVVALKYLSEDYVKVTQMVDGNNIQYVDVIVEENVSIGYDIKTKDTPKKVVKRPIKLPVVENDVAVGTGNG